MILMLGQKRQPGLDRIRVPVLDLDQATHGDALKVLLRLFEDEIGPGDSPALGYTGQGDGAPRAEPHVVCCAHGEVGKEEEVADRVSAQLQVAHGDAVLRGAAQRAEVDGLDVDGGSESVERFLGFGVEGWFVRGEGNAAFSVREGLLDCARRNWVGTGDLLCQLDGLDASALVRVQ